MTRERSNLYRVVFGPMLLSLAGLLVWTLHFGAIYAVQHVACTASGAGGSAIAEFVLAATVAALAALGTAAWAAPRLLRSAAARDRDDLGRFLVAVTRWLVLLSALGVIWAGVSVLFVASCPALR
jgi:hypothetical protein